MSWSRNVILAVIFLIASTSTPLYALEAGDFPAPGFRVIDTAHGFGALVKKLNGAIKGNGMAAVTRASATKGAASLGVTIPGNMVVGVYHPKFAVRMLEASIPTGVEAPLIFYITETPDGTATLSYRTPSAVFAPYGSAALDQMAGELDAIFAAIAAAATAP